VVQKVIINTKVTRKPIATPGNYKKARGVFPWTPDTELPEDTIRRLREGK